MRQITTDEGIRIGELAGRAGLTVRTLHHYDRIGLVRASERTEAGHRRYAEADVRRLYQVVALRSLGVPLAQIARALDGDGLTLTDAVSAQLAAVDAELLRAGRLRRRLERILELPERSDYPSIAELTEVMEGSRCTSGTTRPTSSRRSNAGARSCATSRSARSSGSGPSSRRR